MPTVQAPTQLSVNDLLAAVKQLSPAERGEFARQFAEWQSQNGSQKDEEAALIEATKMRLPASEERRFRRLISKSERGTLTAKDLEEYHVLAQKAEKLNVVRVEALAELVRRRGKPARVVMKEIGWYSPNDNS
ncbi:MAG: hypothetical protein M3347_02380 [Armatimonadota bacterium]|nr:hypothetical protein [Armatimonadota bacterium]